MGLIVIATGGELLLPPQATSNPASARDIQSAATANCFEPFLPANPARTTPARGNENGSNGRRFSARRCRMPDWLPFGPLVVMVTVTFCGVEVALIDDGTLHPRPTAPEVATVQLKVTFPAIVVATLITALALDPAGVVEGDVTTAVLICGWVMTCVSTEEILPALAESPPYTAVIGLLAAVSEDVVNVATCEPSTVLKVPVPMELPLLLKVTVPVGAVDPEVVTFAVKVTEAPRLAGFWLEVRVVEVSGRAVAAQAVRRLVALTEPRPFTRL